MSSLFLSPWATMPCPNSVFLRCAVVAAVTAAVVVDDIFRNGFVVIQLATFRLVIPNSSSINDIVKGCHR